MNASEIYKKYLEGAQEVKQTLQETEKEKIIQALIFYGWKRNDTAKALGISRQTLRNRMIKHGIR